MTSVQTAESRNPYLEGFLAPVGAEVTATDLKVTGKIPEHLDGRYLRNGPNPAAEVDPATYHWFTGDGMVHGVALRPCCRAALPLSSECPPSAQAMACLRCRHWPDRRG